MNRFSYIYSPTLAITYAKKYAYTYNPSYPNYSSLVEGGDCANFISQCLHAGGIPMIGNDSNNTTQDWFCYSNYLWDINKISKTWRGVANFLEFWTLHAKEFRNFSNNALTDPTLKTQLFNYIALGDAINLIHEDNRPYHTLLVVDITPDEILCAAHTNDTDGTPLSKYNPYKFRVYKLYT